MDRWHSSPAARRLARALLGAALLPIVLACGPGAAERSPRPSAGPDPRDAMLAFAQCMREQGVDFPDPQLSEGRWGFILPDSGADPAALREANETCRHLLAGSVPADSHAGVDEEFEAAMLRFARCMRQHGVALPDPVNGHINVRPGNPDVPDPDSAEFRAALEACPLPNQPRPVAP